MILKLKHKHISLIGWGIIGVAAINTLIFLGLKITNL